MISRSSMTRCSPVTVSITSHRCPSLHGTSQPLLVRKMNTGSSPRGKTPDTVITPPVSEKTLSPPTRSPILAYPLSSSTGISVSSG